MHHLYEAVDSLCFEVVEGWFSSHGRVKKKKKKLRHGVSGVMLWRSLGKWDEACRCSGYVTGQQETWFHLFGCDNGSGIISFHSELIWAVSVLLLRYDLLGRWDSSSWLPFYLPLWDNQVYIQISSDERANVYTVCVCVCIYRDRKRREGVGLYDGGL